MNIILVKGACVIQITWINHLELLLPQKVVATPSRFKHVIEYARINEIKKTNSF